MEFHIKLLLISFGTTIVLGLFFIILSKNLKNRHTLCTTNILPSIIQEQTITTFSNVIMILSLLITLFLSLLLFRDYFKDVYLTLFPLILTSVFFGFIGFFDDLQKLFLREKLKLNLTQFIGITIVSIFFMTYILNILDSSTVTLIPLSKMYIHFPLWFYVPFVIFLFLVITYSITLTNDVDGLTCIISFIIIMCLTIIGIIVDVKEVVILGCIALGICLGFLIFNLNPAKLLLGKTGSLLLGGIIVILALYLKMPFVLLIVAVLPILNTVYLMLQALLFNINNKNILKIKPLHNHLELSGLSKNKVTFIFSIFTLIFSCIAIMLAV